MTTMKKILSTIFFLYFIKSSVSSNPPYKIDTIPSNTNAGIFYQNLGNVATYNGYLSLLSFNNLTFYKRKSELANKMFSETGKICKTYLNDKTQSDTCRQLLPLVKHQIVQINNKFSTITHLTDHSTRINRVRRGLVNGLSTGLKWLIGTPDRNDAQFYSKAIRSLQGQNRDFAKRMKQQVHLVSSAIESYNKSIKSFQDNEKRLNRNIEIFNNFTKDISETFSILSHIELLTQLVIELNEEYDVIIDSLLFAKQDIIHPFVIKPTDLKKELLGIELKPNLQLPIPLDENTEIHPYISLSKLSVIYDNENLIYIIKIPLVTKEAFTLYNLVPLPSPVNQTGVFSYIDPTYPYLIWKSVGTQYALLDDISSCVKLPDTSFICPRPVIYSVNKRPICETQLMKRYVDKIPADCTTKSIKADMEIWHKLNPHRWLYVTSHKIRTKISCETLSENVPVELRGVGILDLQPGCSASTRSTQLTAAENFEANFTNYIPPLDINFDECCIKRQEMLENYRMEAIDIGNVDLDELRHAHRKLEKMEEIWDVEINKPFLTRNHGFFTILASSTTIMIMLVLGCFCCSRYCFHCSRIPYFGHCLPQKKGNLKNIFRFDRHGVLVSQSGGGRDIEQGTLLQDKP